MCGARYEPAIGRASRLRGDRAILDKASGTRRMRPAAGQRPPTPQAAVEHSGAMALPATKGGRAIRAVRRPMGPQAQGSMPATGSDECRQPWLLAARRFGRLRHRARGHRGRGRPRRRRSCGRLSDDRVGRAVLDAALAVLGHAALEADVALLAPAAPPGVLHPPIVDAVRVGAVAHEQHAVVELRAALLGQDAAAVELEGHLVRLDGHRHRLLGHGLHQRTLVLRRHVVVALHAAAGDALRAVGLLAPAL
mmetsp:Transcript_62021/g.192532  ORF Transcript_62021/g.192532 Transcript_62021/m.192532 type:complete len:251 (+) Transcript_62021:325-1077(+)